MRMATVENLQTFLLLALVWATFGPEVKRLVRRVRARRDQRRLSVQEVQARCVEVRDRSDAAAHVVSGEVKRRLWLIRSGPNDVA